MFLIRGSIAAAVLLCALAATQAAEPKFPPGSRIGVIPPTGFSSEGNLRGFIDRERQALMMLVEMPASAFGEIEKTLTPQAMKSQGIVQDKREAVTLAAGKGFLIMGRQQAEGTKFRKWIYVVRRDELTALVTVQIPETARAAYSDASIRASLDSLTVRAEVPIDESIALLPFRLTELSGMRAVRVAGPSVLLTDGPKDSLEAATQPHVIVAAAAGSPPQPDQRDSFARTLLGGLAGYKDLRITGSEMLRLPGQQVHELRAEGKHADSNADVKMVQWIRFGPSAFVQIVGVAPAEGWSEAFGRFRAVRDGVTPR